MPRIAHINIDIIIMRPIPFETGNGKFTTQTHANVSFLSSLLRIPPGINKIRSFFCPSRNHEFAKGHMQEVTWRLKSNKRNIGSLAFYHEEGGRNQGGRGRGRGGGGGVDSKIIMIA